MGRVCVQRQFDEKDSKHFRCCGHCHVLTGTKVIAFIHSVLLVLGAAGVAYVVGYLPQVWTVTLFLLAFPLLIHIVTNGCLWRGVLRQREGYLIPFMVQTVFHIIAVALVPIGIIGHFLEIKSLNEYYSPYYKAHSRLTPLYVSLIVLAVCIYVTLHIWSFFVVKKAYNCIQYKRFIKMCHSVQLTQQVYAPVPQIDMPPPTYDGEQRTWNNTSGFMNQKYPLHDV